MQVRETNLKELVQGEKQFRVPLWQRQYTWRLEDHKLLWHDILEQYSRSGPGSGAESGHFLGSVVLSPIPFPASGVASYLIVDGQQRLTTLMVILCAIRDAAAKLDPQATERYDELYLINKFHEGEARYRLVPTQADRESFFACVTRSASAGGQDPIGQAYRFFRSHVELLDADEEPLDLERLAAVVVERLAVVDITTGQGDNAHRIFQSLNATGVNLTQADLLRNLVFMLLPTRGDHVYHSVWRPMERLIGFENLEGLARVDLQRQGIDVAVDDVYRRHQDRFEAMTGGEPEVEAAVEDLARRAGHYKRLIDPSAEVDLEISASLMRLRRWGAQTSYPILMVAYDLRDRELLSVEGMRRAVSYVESFLVRRQLAGIPTNSLNRLFVQLVDLLPEDQEFPEALRRELSRQRRYWPSDDQLREAVRTRPFYLSGRAQQRKIILERLEESYGHPERIDFERADLTIEHVLPQTLSDEWRAHLIELGQEPEDVHDSLVHTLGNLTLTAFNGTLSNNPFERKKQIYSGSHLELNRALAEQTAWGEDEILARADELAGQAIAMWPSPLPGVADTPVGFDWSRINAAIEAIPRGRWTTYGDLAHLGATAAMPVGQHVADTPGLENAYRVLGSDGKPRPDFRWTDPHDGRDVLDVLKTDGVRFNDLGAADSAQRIRAVELAVLIGVLDDDEQAAEISAASGQQDWDWARYSSELNIPNDRLEVGRALVDLLTDVIAGRNLAWKPAFRKGYVAFQRAGGYNAIVVDVWWRKTPRFAVKIPGSPAELELVNPYPELEDSWYPVDREWGWTLDTTVPLPDVRPAVELAARFAPENGHAGEVDREQVRVLLTEGLTPDQVYQALGRTQLVWVAAIEEEARLEDELGSYPADAATVAFLRDERKLRWERVAARVFGDARRVRETRELYEASQGEGAAMDS